MDIRYTVLKCDYCDHKMAPIEGTPAKIRNDRRKYTPDSPLWAVDEEGNDVCWYCINSGVPWVHYVTGKTHTGPFAPREDA